MEEFFVIGKGATDGVLQEILGWCQGTPLILMLYVNVDVVPVFRVSQTN